MKKQILALALVFGIGMLASSCNNDNEGETLIPLAGTWNINKVGTVINGNETLVDPPQNEPGCSKDYMQLKSDNTVAEGNYYSSSVNPCALTVNSGIYSRSHNNLTTVVNEVSETKDILNLTAKELKLRDAGGGIEVFVRD
jgi:hypothetical protein